MADTWVELDTDQNPAFVKIPGATSAVTAFRRTIAQPADGNSFTVSLPTAQANANYKVTATLADAGVFVTIAIPLATRTVNDFVCQTSAPLNDGDSIDFEVVAG